VAILTEGNILLHLIPRRACTVRVYLQTDHFYIEPSQIFPDLLFQAHAEYRSPNDSNSFRKRCTLLVRMSTMSDQPHDSYPWKPAIAHVCIVTLGALLIIDQHIRIAPLTD